MTATSRYTGLIERYRDRLPVSGTTHVISPGEGNAPLARLENISRVPGREVDLYIKYEGLNPTGSFKDRGMTLAVTHAVEEGNRAIICASTGNTSATAVVYAARAGITAFVVIPEGSSIVCTLTGRGVKDPDTAIRPCDEGMLTVDAELGAVKATIL